MMTFSVRTLVAVGLLGAVSMAHAADVTTGKAAYEKLNCASCHGADARTPIDPSYPVLAGQHADYLKHALRAYQRGASGGTAANARNNPIMGAFASQMSSQDIENVSAWLATLPSDLGVRR